MRKNGRRFMLMDFLMVTAIACLIGICVFAIYATRVDAMPRQEEPTKVTSVKLTPEEIEKGRNQVQKVEKEEKLAISEEKTASVGQEVQENLPCICEEIPLDAETQIFFRECCKTYHVGYAFALAMMESESTFRADAVGDSGRSIGYMQINVPNQNRYGLNASYEFDNIEIGVRMLSELMEKHDTLDAVVMCYKGGEGAYKKWQAEGFRLSACDEIAERAMYWQKIIDGKEE